MSLFGVSLCLCLCLCLCLRACVFVSRIPFLRLCEAKLCGKPWILRVPEFELQGYLLLLMEELLKNSAYATLVNRAEDPSSSGEKGGT